MLFSLYVPRLSSGCVNQKMNCKRSWDIIITKEVYDALSRAPYVPQFPAIKFAKTLKRYKTCTYVSCDNNK